MTNEGEGNPRLVLSKEVVEREQCNTLDEDEVHCRTRIQRRYSLHDMLGLFAMSFCYGLIFQSVVVLVIPTEVQRLIQTKQSVWMSLIMAGGAVSQLSTPVVGAWSDRLHKRVTFLVYGSMICVVGITLFLAVKAANSLVLLFVAHMTTMIGLSVIYSMICALLNDCILPEQIGTGSGAIAILATLGSGCGYALFAIDIPLEYTYLTYIATCILCLGISVLYIPRNLDAMLKKTAEKIKERQAVELLSQSDDGEVEVQEKPRGTFGLFLDAITMPSPSRHPDFTFACLSRLLFNSGLAAQVYMAYYFRDVLLVKYPTQMVSIVAVSTLVGCIIAALPAGMLSDKVGKKPVVYTGVLVCMTSILLFLVTRSKEHFLILGLVCIQFFVQYLIPNITVLWAGEYRVPFGGLCGGCGLAPTPRPEGRDPDSCRLATQPRPAHRRSEGPRDICYERNVGICHGASALWGAVRLLCTLRRDVGNVHDRRYGVLYSWVK